MKRAFKDTLGRWLYPVARTPVRTPVRTCRDEFVVYEDDPYRAEHLLLDDFLQTYERPFADDPRRRLRERPEGRRLLESDDATRIRLVKAALIRHRFALDTWSRRRDRTFLNWRCVYDALHVQLLRRALPFTAGDLTELLGLLARGPALSRLFPFGLFVQSVGRYLKAHGDHPDVLAGLQELVDRQNDLDKKTQAAARTLLGRTAPLVDPGDPWGAAVQTLLAEQAPPAGRAWRELLTLAGRQSRATNPSRRFLTAAGDLIARIGPEAYRDALVHLIDTATALRPQAYPLRTSRWGTYTQIGLFAAPEHATLLCSFVWTASLLDAPPLDALAGLATTCYTRIPGQGPAAARLGNGCIRTLGRLGTLEAVGALVQLRHRIKQRSARALIDRQIEAAAERNGLSREEVEDLAVPTFGLTGGVLRRPLGAFTAELAVTGTSTVALRWIRADGTRQKSVPAAVKRDHPDALAALKRTAQAVKKTLPSQRDRLDGFYLARRTLTFSTWQARYLDHGLLGTLTRRLIWSFGTGDDRQEALWIDGALRDVEGRPLAPPAAGTPVRLWHPVNAAPEDVLAWRTVLDRHRIRQPFKQAHRELYLVTDAERETDLYSNRFAAHILRQHQFRTLAEQRGWRYALIGAYDGGDTGVAERWLPAWDLRVEFWVDSIPDENQYTDAGIWLYVSTDQVRFFDAAGRSVSIADVPHLALSEVLRDVDLFVGVSSIGNDPTWVDRGDEPRFRNYWHSFAFGDLTDAARIRRTALETLLPRLRIADRCELDGKFLVVRGDLRTYKIHIGSTNILMAPNDAYLCIVPDRRAGPNAERLFVPFEGDPALSLLLSKAFLLAADTQIADPTILRQIRRRAS